MKIFSLKNKNNAHTDLTDWTDNGGSTPEVQSPRFDVLAKCPERLFPVIPAKPESSFSRSYKTTGPRLCATAKARATRGRRGDAFLRMHQGFSLIRFYP
jgi:hypothetical protein